MRNIDVLESAENARFSNRGEWVPASSHFVSDWLSEVHCSVDQVHALDWRRLHQLTDEHYILHAVLQGCTNFQKY
jgi:hypothetical protein